MTMAVCPRCQQWYSYSPHSGDYVHRCNSTSEVLKNEDIPIIGNATNPDGTSVQRTSQMANFAAAENIFQGTRAELEGERFHELTSRGKWKGTHQTRQHFEHIEEPGA